MNNSTSFRFLFPLIASPFALAACTTSVSVEGNDSDTGNDSARSTSATDARLDETSAVGGESAPGGVCSGPSVGLPNTACTPTAAECNSQHNECLAVHENAGAAAFGLRMADLTLTAPAALTQGIVQSILKNAVTPGEPSCNLGGTGTFSWLLDFDTAAGTLTTGGALPQTQLGQAYSFAIQNVPLLDGGTLHIGPKMMSAPLHASCQTTSSKASVNMPIYLDQAGANLVVFPLRKARFSGITVSGNHDCVGRYNAAALDPANGCFGDDITPAFVHAGKVDAFIPLDVADTLPIAPLGQSLCVLLSGDSAAYGNGASPMNRCKRVNGKIAFQGDWCVATDQPASGACHDAVRFSGTFAASGVAIN